MPHLGRFLPDRAGHFGDDGGPPPPNTPSYRPPTLYDPNSGQPPQAGDYYYATDPNSGRITRFEYIDEGGLFGTQGWVSADDYFSPTGPGGGADPAYLAETIRSNMEREAENRRRRALDAATNAVQAYLTGTQLADARRLNAFQESRLLLPYLVSPEQEYFAGQEPDGVLEGAAERFGITGFRGTKIQKKELAPSQLAVPPTEEQTGSQVLDYIRTIEEKGNAT